MAEIPSEAQPQPKLEALPEEPGKTTVVDVPAVKFGGDWRKYAAVKISTEFDSETKSVINKISARVLDGFGKIKASFQREFDGKIRYPQLGLVTKYLTVLYDHEDHNALVTASADLGRRLQLKLLSDVKSSPLWYPRIRLVTKYLSVLYHPDDCYAFVTASADLGCCFQMKLLIDTKAQQGELKLLTKFANSRYKAEVSYDVPSTGLPRASLTFPNGEIKLADEVHDEGRALSINGFIAGNFMNGMCMAEYKGESLNLKYAYKDEEMTLIPSVSLPSQDLSFAFKRRFNPLNKLSYLYNFNSAAWSTIYKYKPNDDYKIKVGYDSSCRLGWASAWVGKEEVGAKKAPRKLKFQVMLQVPQDSVQSSAVLFRLKKRWDL